MQDNWGSWSHSSGRSHRGTEEKGGNGHRNPYFGLKMRTNHSFILIEITVQWQPVLALNRRQLLFPLHKCICILPVFYMEIICIIFTYQEKYNYKKNPNSSHPFLRASVFGCKIQILGHEYCVSRWKWRTVLCSSRTGWCHVFHLNVFKGPKVKFDIPFYLKSEQCPCRCIKIQSTDFTEMCLFYSKIKAFCFS